MDCPAISRAQSTLSLPGYGYESKLYDEEFVMAVSEGNTREDFGKEQRKRRNKKRAAQCFLEQIR